MKRLGEGTLPPPLSLATSHLSTAIYMVLLGKNGLDCFLGSWNNLSCTPYKIEPTWSSLTDLEEMIYIHG